MLLAITHYSVKVNIKKNFIYLFVFLNLKSMYTACDRTYSLNYDYRYVRTLFKLINNAIFFKLTGKTDVVINIGYSTNLSVKS